MKFLLMPFLFILSACGGTPVELGQVNWERKLEPSLARSEVDRKPIFLLFQEIPG